MHGRDRSSRVRTAAMSHRPSIVAFWKGGQGVCLLLMWHERGIVMAWHGFG